MERATELVVSIDKVVETLAEKPSVSTPALVSVEKPIIVDVSFVTVLEVMLDTPTSSCTSTPIVLLAARFQYP